MAIREGYLTTQEATARYGIGVATLYRRRDEGKLTAYKFMADKLTYWKLSELEKLFPDDDGPSERRRREIVN